MKPFLLVAITALVLGSCRSTYNTVYTDYDRSVDFKNYKTFAWLPDKADSVNSPYNNEIIRNNIRNYLGQCLSDRAYVFDGENPDLLLQLIIINTKKEKVQTSTYPSLYYYRPYYFGSLYYVPYHYNYYFRYYPTYAPYSYGPEYSNTQKIEYVNGAITLNIIERKTNKLIWTGTAEGDIYDPSMISKDLHPSVHRILSKYPVKPTVISHRIK